MATEFMLKDTSGRGINSKVDIDHLLRHFGDEINDEDDVFAVSVGEWATDARFGDTYRLDGERVEIFALNDEVR